MVAFSSAERSPRGVTARATGCAPCAPAAAVTHARSSALSKRKAAGLFTGRAKPWEQEPKGEQPFVRARSIRRGPAQKAGLRQLDLASADAAGRQTAAESWRRAGNEDRRGGLPAQLLQFTHCSIHPFLRRVAVLLHSLAQTRGIDFETDRQRPHVGENLGFSDVD